jgi:hypothetical protein
MQSIVIYPENAEQLKAIKAFLKDMKVQFEPQSNTFPPHVIAGIEEKHLAKK